RSVRRGHSAAAHPRNVSGQKNTQRPTVRPPASHIWNATATTSSMSTTRGMNVSFSRCSAIRLASLGWAARERRRLVGPELGRSVPHLGLHLDRAEKVRRAVAADPRESAHARRPRGFEVGLLVVAVRVALFGLADVGAARAGAV